MAKVKEVTGSCSRRSLAASGGRFLLRVGRDPASSEKPHHLRMFHLIPAEDLSQWST